MRAIVCDAWGPPETLTLKELPSPPLGAGEVRIRIRAAGVNFPDVLMIYGKYQRKPPFPFTPGLEMAGEVVEVTSGVTHLKAGDRVFGMCGVGGFASEIVMRADMVWKMPEAMSWIEGAAFPVVYLTSYYALNNRAKLKAGETLLVLGAAGGVGLTACEIGAAMGADVIAVASTAEKRALAAQYGARRQIDYGPARLRDSVNELTGGKGADVIYDPVGGDAFDECLRCIAWGGRLLVVGFASGRIASAPANLLLLKGAELRGIRTAGWREQFPHEADVAMQGVLALYSAGKLRPYVSTVLPLEKAPDALKILDGRQATGKVVLDVDA